MPTSAPSTTPVLITPPTATVTSKSGLSTTTIAATSGGGVLVLILLLLRRKQATASNAPGTGQRKGDDADGGECEYTNVSNAQTLDDTFTTSGVLSSGLVLAAKQLPYRDFRFGDVISQGGFGEVVKGYYHNQVVAIKRLLAARRRDRASIDSFVEEIQLTATLRHECLVTFLGFAWDTPTNLCMVSEFMSGGDLRNLLISYTKRGDVNGLDDGKLRIALQVAQALQYLHGLATPVIHRDLKSRNVLLSAEGHAKLIDFGISTERQDSTMTAGVGTKLWMAPEVMLGQRYGEKSDVLSFGVMLSELDTHALPYDHACEASSDRKLTEVLLTQLISTGPIYPRFTTAAEPAVVEGLSAFGPDPPTDRVSAGRSPSLDPPHGRGVDDRVATDLTRQCALVSNVVDNVERVKVGSVRWVLSVSC